jgi:hypothetical protein
MENRTPKEYANFLFKEVEERSMQSSGYSKDASIFLIDEFIKWCQPTEDCGFSLEPTINYWTSVKYELIKIEL